MFRKKREMELTKEEEMTKLIKAIKNSDLPKGDAKILAFIIKNQDCDLLKNISIQCPYTDTNELTPKE